MFKDIQQPFQKHCPDDRKNFLSYSYVLHKFCELLELDEFLKCFPYLKAGVKKITAPHTPVPFSPPMEDFYIPSSKKIIEAVRELINA